MKKLFLLFATSTGFAASAQYAPQAGIAGSTAIPATSSLFAGWATGCSLHRGYLDIANTASGYTSLGEEANATGMPDGSLISLGDSGVATLTFAAHLFNGEGADFAVFENGFKNPADAAMAFLELAFVEVSSDGNNFFRFPAYSNTPVSTQIPGSGVYMDAALIHNLAGKYVSGYGTPFDLNDLAGTPGLDVNNVTHVRIIDVTGALSPVGSTDHEGKRINDPYPTNFPTGGFDLEAVGAINMISTGVATHGQLLQAGVFPNPATGDVRLMVNDAIAGRAHFMLTSVTGSVLLQGIVTSAETTISVAHFPAGIYYLSVSDDNANKWTGKLIKY
jgi:hypothetical protein